MITSITLTNGITNVRAVVPVLPTSMPAALREAWASVPNCAEIWLLFRLTPFGPILKVKCEGWGQLANDDAAAGQAMYHIKNRRPLWWAKYVGWQEVGGKRQGHAPRDFAQQYRDEWKER